MSTESLRRQLRQRRRAISPAAQQRAATAVAEQLQQQRWFAAAHRVALYSASDGEVATQPLYNGCQRRGSDCLLPIIAPHHQLLWALWQRDAILTANRYGILEPPAPGQLLALTACQVVVVPLVGFDRDGNRIGMGGGYYDRALGALASSNRPITVGIAHSCQEVAKITPQKWDIPLDYIVTERELLCAKQK